MPCSLLRLSLSYRGGGQSPRPTGASASFAFVSDARFRRETPDPYLTDASPRFHEALGFRKCGAFTACAVKFGRVYDMGMWEKRIGRE